MKKTAFIDNHIPEHRGSSNSSVANAYKQIMQKQKFSSVKDMVADLAKRTGLTSYIEKVNAEIQKETVKEAQFVASSLIELKFVQEAVDSAIARKHYTEVMPLLNELEKIVKVDSQIPEELKNVKGDQKLIDYIKEKLGKKDDRPAYNLKPVEREEATTKDMNTSILQPNSIT